MKTIGNIIHQNIFPLRIFDDNGNEIYHEALSRKWRKWKYNDKEKVIHFEDSHGIIWNISNINNCNPYKL